jgi:hypothetical protein
VVSVVRNKLMRLAGVAGVIALLVEALGAGQKWG